MTVWVDFWQMQCCGEPFRTGDQVAWTVRATDPDWLEVMLGPQAPVLAFLPTWTRRTGGPLIAATSGSLGTSYG